MKTNIHFYYVSLLSSWNENVSDKSCRENQNTHFVFTNFFFENCALYEIMWRNIVERGKAQMKIWRMPITKWIPKATNTQLSLCNTRCF
jgi:hypothetical protein